MGIAVCLCVLLLWVLYQICRRVHAHHTMIVTRNVAGSIEQFLYWQMWFGCCGEVTVLDVGSSDDTVRIVERWRRKNAPTWQLVIVDDWHDVCWWWASCAPSRAQLICLTCDDAAWDGSHCGVVHDLVPGVDVR
ncbi:MAG: hypothetical protein KGO83_03425 [Paenibacillaceae bacterium]|nr:hypothetical protein [Paenibacillaceae bacterium]